ncbi:polysaccharide biosynthesis tyrosine autokinase [Leptolyngbyaceae cyanobacterium CCMR0082]|uniref:Polysaccharide biosynthesis tyrosine autokinase n=2 Tax=Adonisia turfae TaxID=2950184 RepID=A0A6M0S1N5_9CYAN|nr:polysaccharide biosynthesis tyrosine autokinase [Adonisia turfae]MDV3347643.1 polysaccharide biosynthesis tyrosine autokinase [Leptothoe sp. LEGE 181152]NEZ55789.1 polysaccharide biosynthesis tyrosine autokinase [Adonisia turfae CCMR0081]NEZ62338.1 polysaccharide biosynthesis tyrosine autokinase [Adonisia turfae CCMR0082]
MASQDNSVKEIEIDLQKYWRVLKRRWLIALTVFGLTTTAAVGVGITQKPEYQAESKLLFELSNQASALVGLEGGNRELRALTNLDNPLDTQIEVFRSIPLVQKVIETLKLQDDEGELLQPEDLLKSLTVTGVPGTDVLKVTYTSEDPEIAATVVNTLADIYIENDIQTNRAAALAAQEFITAQLPESEEAVEEAEASLRRFKEGNNIVDLEEESRNLVESLFTLDNALIQLKSQLADSSAQASQLQQKLKLSSDEAYAVGLVSESPGIQTVLAQLQTVQSDLTLARTRYRDEHPEIITLRNQEAGLQALLQERLDVTLGANELNLPSDDLQSGQLEQDLIAEYLRLDGATSGLQQQVEELTTARLGQQSRARVIPVLEKQERALDRQLAAAQTTYETLLQNLQQAQVLENQNIGNARIVSPALIPNEPLGPSLKLFLMTGGFAGLLLGLITAFMADLLDQSVKTVQEGQELYEYPLLGIIPAWKRGNAKGSDIPSILVKNSEYSSILDAYQALQANLKFSCVDTHVKTVTVTSAVGGEGKSEVAANLALTLAHLGHTVLLVDADLRKPTQHHIWDLPNVQGLSNFASGQVPLKDVIVSQEPNLHILTAGVIPFNPLAVLESQLITSLLQASEKAYDYIIIDSPPILGLVDAITIGRATDGVLLVMRPGMANAENIRATKTMLAQSKQNVLGLVANGINVKGNTDRYFYNNQDYTPIERQANFVNVPNSQSVSDPANVNGRL